MRQGELEKKKNEVSCSVRKEAFFLNYCITVGTILWETVEETICLLSFSFYKAHMLLEVTSKENMGEGGFVTVFMP